VITDRYVKRVMDWLMVNNRLLWIMWGIGVIMLMFALYSWGRYRGWTVVAP
jgi:hypothetical protein